MFLRNAWYMAGWSQDFSASTLTPLVLLNEPIVVYRKTDGALAALEDRCRHRLAPLSVGRQEGDDLRCMYHGLKFAPDGRCVEIPGQERISAAVRVRSYPILERHTATWIWMGEPAKADPALIPPVVGTDHPDWALVSSRLEIAANATLINDNLLDISHAIYVHGKSFAGGDPSTIAVMMKGEKTLKVTRLERGVRTERWHLDRPSNPYSGAQQTDDQVVNEVLVPGVFLQTTRAFAPGVIERCGAEPDEEPLLARCTCQVVTPVTDRTSILFFNFGPMAKDAARKSDYFRIGEAAFQEDKAIIEAQQRIIDMSPGVGMTPLAMDVAVMRFDSLMKRLLAEEAPTPGAESLSHGAAGAGFGQGDRLRPGFSELNVPQ